MRLLRGLCIGLVAIAGMCWAWCAGEHAASAQEGGFTETFDDPSLPGWEVAGPVEVSDGQLLLGPGGVVHRPLAFDSGEISFRAMLGPGEGGLECLYRSSESGSYVLRLTGVGLSIQRSQAGSTTSLGEAEAAIPRGEWITVRIVLQGGEQVASVSQPAVAVTIFDPDPLGVGGLILSASGAVEAHVDDLTVTGLIEPEPLPESQAGPQPEPSTAQLLPVEQLTWVRLGGPPGGLGYDIRMRPDDPDIMFVTDAHAGIHRSDDGGQTWIPVNQGIATLAEGDFPVFCATIDPHDPNAVWIGTQHTGHVYLSTDGGMTWELRDNGILNHESLSVRGITVDPHDPDIVYIGVEVASVGWAGETIVKRQDLVRGEVYRSTDRGMNWERIWDGDNLARYIWIDPRDSDRLYASTGIFDRDAANSDVPNGIWGGVGILRSDDGGRSWEVLDERNGLGGRYVPSLFMHPTDPDTLLAAVTGTANRGGAFVTHDGGDTWQIVLEMPPGQGMEAVEIATSNPNIWYAAAESRVWRSDDAGETWQDYPISDGARLAGLPIDLMVDPRDPYRIFDNNYGGGNFVSEDGGETWLDASQGYTGISLTGRIGVDPSNPLRVFASNFRSEDGGQTWIGVDTPFMTMLFVPQTGSDEAHVIVGSSGGNVFHGQGEASEWEQVQIVDAFAEAQAGRINEEAQPLRAFAIAPSDPGTLYAGFSIGGCARKTLYLCFEPSLGLYVSHDGGYTWEERPEAPFRDVSILSLAVAPDDPQTAYAGTALGLFRTTDGGWHWERLAGLEAVTGQIRLMDPEPLLADLVNPVVHEIRIDPFQPNTLYAASTPAGVYRSLDGGTTWSQASAGMDPNETVFEILCDPSRPGVLYASTGLSGVYISTDGADTWRQVSAGLTSRDVRGLALTGDGAHLYAGVNNAGVFRLDLYGFPPQVAEPASQSAAITDAPAASTPTAPPPSNGGGGICKGAAILPIGALLIVVLGGRKHASPGTRGQEVPRDAAA